MVRKILGFLIAGVGLYIAFGGANFGLGIVIIGCTIVLMQREVKMKVADVKKNMRFKNRNKEE